ncbi:MAG: glycosyltransferase [Anaerolineae bacterium]|nr:glycosyltransferase [Anaerolineae bacterium]
MKILHVTPSIGPLRGGPSRAVLDMCRGLAQAGADVTLATTDDNGPGRLGAPPGPALAQDGYRILYFRRTTRAYTSSVGLTVWLARHLHEYDLAHLHAAFTYAPLPAAWLARRRGVPYVVTPHGILGAWGVCARRARAKRLSLALVERPILDRAACVHATSAREAEGLRALGLCAPVATVHLGVDAPPLEAVARGAPPPPFPPGRVALLFMGRFHAVKGLDLLLPGVRPGA